MSLVANMADILSVIWRIGISTLPIIEVDKAAVTTPRKRVCKNANAWGAMPGSLLTTTLGHALDELRVDAWPLYHAAAKTELARSFSQAEVTGGAIGFRFQTRTLLVWNRGNLRIRDDGVFSRKDSSRTAIACRFGEAIAYLFMVDRDYVYWAHLPTLVERAMNRARISHREQVRTAKVITSRLKNHGTPRKQPDYAFEQRQGNVALLEAKGSFVAPESKPATVKSDLSYGLEQLAAWVDFIAPRPQKSYAVGTYLRELSDTFSDPSLIAFVDPADDGESISEPIDIPTDWIRRGNYGAWLIAMGFIESGIALRNGEAAETQPRLLHVLEIGGNEYAVVFDGFIDLHSPNLLPQFMLPSFFWMQQSTSCRVVGLEINTLRQVETLVKQPEGQLSLRSRVESPTVDTYPEWFSGSIMPDGSLYGVLHLDRWPSAHLDIQTFEF